MIPNAPIAKDVFIMAWPRERSDSVRLPLLECTDDFVMFRKPVGFKLGKDQFAVRDNVKRPNFAGPYVRIDAELFLDCGRQTGGLW